MAMDYKSAGVDIEQGDALVEWLKTDSQSPKNPYGKVLSGIGGFAALFETQFSKMKNPVLVSATDGIGTKVKLASAYERYSEVGQDLVAMCVNDLACVGATPLFFLDYFATSKLDQKQARDFIGGVRSACEHVNCALIGGETAEMPGVYQERDFDAAGFCVGVVDKDAVIGPHLVKEGQKIIGVHSSGFHSNGYSMVRKLFADDMDQWIESLIKPTKLYSNLVADLMNSSILLSGVAHITGGGIDNLLRVMPPQAKAEFKGWEVPALFTEAKTRAGLGLGGLLRTFNCGMGLMLIVNQSDEDQVLSLVNQKGHSGETIGSISWAPDATEPQWTWDGEAL